MSLMFPKQKKQRRKRRHTKSIIQEKCGYCYLCALLEQDYGPKQLQEHHIFGGPNRKLSEEYGLKVYLCLQHHTEGPEAVHRNAETMELLHITGQAAFERTFGSRDDFINIFGKSYDTD